MFADGALREGRLDHLGPPPIGLLLRDPAHALAGHPQEALDGHGSEPEVGLRLDERNDLQLVLAHSVVWRGHGGPDRLAHDREELEGDAGAVAQFLEGELAQRGEALVLFTFEEVERDLAALESGGQALQRDAGRFE